MLYIIICRIFSACPSRKATKTQALGSKRLLWG